MNFQPTELLMKIFQKYIGQNLQPQGQGQGFGKIRINPESYTKFLVTSFIKFIRDEISAATSYLRFAEIVKTNYVEKELKEHSNEEFEHYSELISYAYKHGFGKALKVKLDQDVVNNIPQDDNGIVQKVQNLEDKAIRDYMFMVKVSKMVGDLETCEFFKELLKDEQEHYDDLSKFLDQSRPLLFMK